MSSASADVNQFFQEYVFGFIATDVQREIDLSRSGQSAGNFLAALGLLCYTEVLGGVARGTLGRGQGKANFDEFFGRLGSHYQDMLQRGFDAYSILRCGMAHEYLIRGRATVSMLKGVEPAAVAETTDGHLFFCVERYFEDFVNAARALQADLMAQPNPALPPELIGRP